MKKVDIRIAALVMATLFLAAALAGCTKAKSYTFAGTEPEQSTIYVSPIEGLTDDFIRGVDVSSYLAEKESGVVYRDFDGKTLDDAGFFNLLAASGVNWVRVRIWNDPADRDGNSYGGGHNDLETAKTIGKLATDAGLKVLADFHYSDFWADPSKQMAPKEWAHKTYADKTQALADYTAESLAALWQGGVDVQMVQIGNETNNGMAGETAQDKQFALMAVGCTAARQAAEKAGKPLQIAVHFTNPEKAGFADYCGLLIDAGADFDVFASSYYPYWHGTLENLTATLTEIEEKYGKQVLVAETAYPFTWEDGDGAGNSVSDTSDGATLGYDASAQGQANAVRDVMAAVHAVGPRALGVFYWEPAWIPVQHYDAAADAATVLAQNKQKWEQYGSGWASSYAKTYDPKDAGTSYGGSSWDNQAMFDFDGNPLESLRVYRYVFSGTTGTENSVVSVDDVEQDSPVGGPATLPDTVLAHYLDGSTVQLPVEWNAQQLAAAATQTPCDVTVEGIAQGQSQTGEQAAQWPVKALLHVKNANFIRNPGFEDGDMSAWDISDPKIVDRTADTNKRSGEQSLKFWSDGAVKYTVTQTLENVPAGEYNLSAWLQGGDAGSDTPFALFVTVNAGGDEQTQELALGVNGWQNWGEADISGITVPQGATVTVGVRADAPAGAWGAWDDFNFALAE